MPARPDGNGAPLRYMVTLMPVTVSGGARGGMQSLVNGTLVADGLEQTLVEYAGLGKVSGYVDLTAMQLGDIVEVRQYVIPIAGGAYALHAMEQYGDIQILPLLHISPKLSYWELKVTLRQLLGAFRSFPYNFALDS